MRNLFSILFFLFACLYNGQIKSKDTLFIKIKNCNDCFVTKYKPIYFTDDFYGEYEVAKDSLGRKKYQLKKDRFVFNNDKLKNKDISKYQIGVETRKCINNFRHETMDSECDIRNYGLVFYHISVSNDFILVYVFKLTWTFWNKSLRSI